MRQKVFIGVVGALLVAGWSVPGVGQSLSTSGAIPAAASNRTDSADANIAKVVPSDAFALFRGEFEKRLAVTKHPKLQSHYYHFVFLVNTTAKGEVAWEAISNIVDGMLTKYLVPGDHVGVGMFERTLDQRGIWDETFADTKTAQTDVMRVLNTVSSGPHDGSSIEAAVLDAVNQTKNSGGQVPIDTLYVTFSPHSGSAASRDGAWHNDVTDADIAAAGAAYIDVIHIPVKDAADDLWCHIYGSKDPAAPAALDVIPVVGAIRPDSPNPPGPRDRVIDSELSTKPLSTPIAKHQIQSASPRNEFGTDNNVDWSSVAQLLTLVGVVAILAAYAAVLFRRRNIQVAHAIDHVRFGTRAYVVNDEEVYKFSKKPSSNRIAVVFVDLAGRVFVKGDSIYTIRNWKQPLGPRNRIVQVETNGNPEGETHEFEIKLVK